MGYRYCPYCNEHLSLSDSHNLKCSMCGHDFSKPEPSTKKQEQTREQIAESKSVMRKKLLFMGYQMGFDVPRTTEEYGLKRWQVNMLHLDSWALSAKSKIRKKINDMSYSELVICVSQFELVYKDFKKRV